METIRAVLVLLLLACLTAGAAYGQAVNATLVGTVTDSSGAVVVNAKVTVTETNTGVSRQMNSNESGNYTFTNLPPGTYAVTAEMTGFKKVNRTGVAVLVDTTVRVDLSLPPG